MEQRKRPELRGLPTAVVQYNSWKGGGLIAVSYEARKFGVKRLVEYSMFSFSRNYSVLMHQIIFCVMMDHLSKWSLFSVIYRSWVKIAVDHKNHYIGLLRHGSHSLWYVAACNFFDCKKFEKSCIFNITVVFQNNGRYFQNNGR